MSAHITAYGSENNFTNILIDYIKHLCDVRLCDYLMHYVKTLRTFISRATNKCPC